MGWRGLGEVEGEEKREAGEAALVWPPSLTTYLMD